jgi:hypothetical protein
MTVNGSLLDAYKEFVTGSMVAFLPLIGGVIGLFLAFAIANQIRHLIMRMK